MCSPRPNASRVQAGILPPISSGSLPAAPKNAEDPDREGHRPESHLPSDTAKIIPAKDTPESGQRPRTGSISGSTPQDPSSPGRTAPESELLGQRPPVQTPESTPKQTPEKTPPSQTLPEPTLPVPETSSPETVPETEEDYRLYSHDFLILDQRLNTEGELSFPAGSSVALPEQSLIGLKRSGENDGKLHAITWRGAHLSAVTEGKAGIYTLLAATQEEMVINTSPYNPLTFVVTIRIE